MATWNDLMDAEIYPLPKQTALFVGEISALVWDKVREATSKYGFQQRIEDPSDLSHGSYGMNDDTAYVAVNPSSELMATLASLLKSHMVESLFVLMDEAPKGNKDFEVIKKRAQHNKNYYTVTPPKSEQAQAKMASYFLLRWAVSKETSFKVCAMLEFSPGKLYMFDKSMRTILQGQVLPSSQTQVIVDALLGTDTPNLVVNDILTGRYIDHSYDTEFNDGVLRFLHSLVYHAKLIKISMSQGNQTVSAVNKATSIPVFLVHRSWNLANSYSEDQLNHSDKLIQLGFKYKNNPELISTLSRVW